MNLFYVGLKVRVVNADKNLYGALLDEYQKRGYLYIADIFENGNVFISYSSHGGLLMSFDRNLLEPYYDENILQVLNNKKEELKRIGREVADIEKFINERCKNSSESPISERTEK
ncbi:hypothetical protein [Konateibacter massiliensis]|uniref:hypothetical protein n=1 Tax=Konateibacter massiliensis TaxID=2002841 RepID=UPI00117BCB17|nr:hypothetical protein [Konateibacter massiliensis]